LGETSNQAVIVTLNGVVILCSCVINQTCL
jgi:hypothetical protein